ncbi:hypothetical protein [Candidatus Phytoplasma pruni]|uniref:Uncharacterized protein n=1 Tax=Candidatus Phytoplasma pruni TaxID=479893 RepID=A0A851HJJ1_9MOLU|nr:hypothetical protein [Candidatus Phytoplasma pruni]NWN45716.1 hypothetical protein [Candidatus Phytoplasma pruni]
MSLTIKQIKTMTPDELNKYFNKNLAFNLFVITPSKVKILSGEQIAKLDPGNFYVFPWRCLTKKQRKYLTAEQLEVIKENKKDGPIY